MNKINFLFIFLLFLLIGCATYKPKYSERLPENEPSDIEVEKTFYLIGDAGGAEEGGTTTALEAFKKLTDTIATQEDFAIFLGDNIYERGLPPKDDPSRQLAEHRINMQLEAVSSFNGEVLFIPGNHDWRNGLKGLKRQEKFIQNALNSKDVFQPKNGCPYKKIAVTPNIEILVIDTEWYITNWDNHPTVNDDCDIKTRDDFFIEIEDELKKNNEKTIILTMHHPGYTYGTHGGHFSIDKHLFPFQSKIPMPGLASIIAQVRSQGGVSPQDRSNKLYSELMDRLITLSKDSDRLILVSGHEHGMQYIDFEGIKQIVSGSGSKSSATFLGEGAQFSSGEAGFAVLKVFTDGSSRVSYYSAIAGKPKLLFETDVHKTQPSREYNFPKAFNSTQVVSAYKKEETTKSKSYEWFWGDHYRYVYGTDLKVPVATLDTLYGGLSIERKGGGHQTRSLRLIDKEGKNFSLRAVKKSAVQFLQSVAFKDNYVEKDFEETVTEEVLWDFYTSSHPYAAFTVAELSEAINLYHTNPMLLYVPKHAALGKYNEEYGDELYVIEERPDDGFLDVPSFGKPTTIESTDDVLKKLRRDEKYKMDEAAFIKARLFDMLIGDWDRHQDQWRWSRFDVSDTEKIYRPIPRDRDQAFSKYDGALLDILKFLVPASRQFQEFKEDQKDLQWINSAGIKLDYAFTQTSTKEVWLEQAKFIQDNLTDEAIALAFQKFPAEVQDDVLSDIVEKLKSRREGLVDLATRYYDYLSKLVILTGTDKDDFIEITRGDRQTTISFSRLKKGKVQKPYKSRILYANETKEIWIYGLDDDDQFVVNGNGRKPIFIRIIGGQNNDSYTIENGKAVNIYDSKHTPNTIEKRGGAVFKFNDIYDNNIYNYKKYISKTNSILPSVGYNPDDGIKVGVEDVYTIKGFKNNPFHQKHQLKAAYLFATYGFDFQYKGEFAQVIGKWNLLLNGRFTSENFTQNFFGFGNETENIDDVLGMDYNRVRTGLWKLAAGVVKNGFYGSRLAISGIVEGIEVEPSPDRFISDYFREDSSLFDEHVNFASLDVVYSYINNDNDANPTRGMSFVVNTGIKSNLADFKRSFGYINPSLEFYNALTKNREWVLRTQLQGQFNIGDAFEFYDAATLGANTGLRAYREQRFSGNSALAFGGDLRYSFKKLKTGLLPVQFGVFGGADVGRVWYAEEDSDKWHDSFGGGFWINAVDTVSGKFGLFSGNEGLRFAFGFGMSL